jgi:phosphoserine phosphatase
MVVFDLDGTLTPVDSLWRYLHDAFGTWELARVAAVRYRKGEISYKEWAETDARHWAGAPMPEVKKIIDGIPYREGASDVFEELKGRGVKVVILSAGLSLLAEKAARELGADLAIANELRTNDGRLTGEIDVKVAVTSKQEIVREIASKFNIPLREIALVGDRALDLANVECLRIAFMPKDDVARREADHVVEDVDLRAILQYLI